MSECLPGCKDVEAFGTVLKMHVEGCPESAPKPDPPKWCNRVEHGSDCPDWCSGKPKPPSECLPECGDPKSRHWDGHAKGCPKISPKPEPPPDVASEPDEVMNRLTYAEDEIGCRGYLDPARTEIVALRSENAALRDSAAVSNGQVLDLIAENSALKAQNEQLKKDNEFNKADADSWRRWHRDMKQAGRIK